LTYGGTLVITNAGTSSFSAGDSFQLFNATNFLGNFTNISPAIPDVNLAWNTNNLRSGILSVIASPTVPPTISTVNLSSSNFILSGSNGVINWPFYVLASTNPALPLTNWTIVSTNAFDANGNFIFTNPNSPSPHDFYLLELK